MSEGRIRGALPADEMRVRRIVEAAYAPWAEIIGRRPIPMDADYAALIASGAVDVLDDGRAVTGVLVLIEETDALLVENVAIDPGAQGCGNGTRLLDHAETEARRRGYETVRLYTNEKMTRNIAHYVRRGFVETHREGDAAFRRVFMEKRVPGGSVATE